MTGLDIDHDVIIEIACFVTDFELKLLEPEGYRAVIHQSKEVMDSMGEWCTRTHEASGLTAAVLSSTTTPDQAAVDLLSYVKRYAPEPQKALLAGNSIHADQAFLRKRPYDKLINHLHHRVLDVSAIKEAARRWAPENILEQSPQKAGSHTAREDILESIAEARFYRSVFFRKP
jgi:oligoribonuclease